MNANRTGCEVCPAFTWPEVVGTADNPNTDTGNGPTPVTAVGGRMRCASISPTVLRIDDPLSLVLIALAALTTFASLAVAFVYAMKRNHRLIKATSKELSAIVLCGWLTELPKFSYCNSFRYG